MLARCVRHAASIGLFAAALVAAPAAAVPVVDGEFEVSALETNNKLAQGPDGNVWVTLSDATNDVARVTPGGEVTEFDLEAANAQGIATGPDGFLWLTRNGGVTKFEATDPVNSKDPTEMIEVVGNHAISTGPDGNLWVATNDNLIKFAPGNPAGYEKTPLPGLSPRGIAAAGPLLAIADFAGEKIVTSTTSGETVDYPVGGGSQGVAGSPGGLIAFTQPSVPPHELGLLTPPGPPQFFPVPETDPFGIALGPDGAFWAAQFVTDSLARLTPEGGLTSLSGLAAGSGPRQIAAGPGNTLWVTLEKTNKVARVSGVDPPPPPPPAVVPVAPGPAVPARPGTRIVKGPKRKVRTRRGRAVVKFRFVSRPRGARFQCALNRLKRRRAKASRVRFRSCKSPKRYRLRPGVYRFRVRAVLAGVRDATPAKRTFRVVRVRRKRR